MTTCNHSDLDQSQRFLDSDACWICLESENEKLKKDLETATLALKAIASMPDSSEISRLKEMLERMAETAILIQSWSHARQRPYVNWDSEVALKLEIAIAEYQKWKENK